MKRIVLYLLLSLFSSAAFSQAGIGLGANDSIIGLNSYSVNIGDSSGTCSVWIKNKGTTVLNGTCYLNIGVIYGGTLNISATDSFPLSGFTPNDSTQHFFSILYQPPDFKIGPDIIVIWPAMMSVPTLDSAFYTVYAYGGLSVIKIGSDKKISVYPNPVIDELRIKREDSPRNIVASVRIRDISGRLIKELYNKDIIPIGEYEKGIYILEISFKDGSSGRYKVIKE